MPPRPVKEESRNALGGRPSGAGLLQVGHLPGVVRPRAPPGGLSKSGLLEQAGGAGSEAYGDALGPPPAGTTVLRPPASGSRAQSVPWRCRGKPRTASPLEQGAPGSAGRQGGGGPLRGLCLLRVAGLGLRLGSLLFFPCIAANEPQGRVPFGGRNP